MLPFSWYMLKVMICSGILFGYYWLFLRNKVFHHYNRFYLLVSMLLSLLLPLLKINFWQAAEQNQAIRVLQVVSVGDDYVSNVIAPASKINWSVEQLYSLAYLLVSLIFFSFLLRTLFIIRTLLKKYPVQQVEEVAFVNTQHDSTPFSFLKYIFWNSHIDMETTTGRQIFKHELAHVQEKHTHDKLFVNMVLIFGWCNPFFWLYRKELNMIHEFIADKKAVEDSDTAAFAAMILQAAYPRQQFQLTNNFFYSPIKRRLLMLSKNKNPKANYIGRIMVLPLIVFVFAAFSLKAKHAKSKPGTQFNIISNATDKAATPPLIDNLFKSVTVKNTMDTVPKKIAENTNKEEKPLYILNGQEIDEKTLSAISPSDIEMVNVIKDKNAIAKYGDKAKNGVVEIVMKKQVVTVDLPTNAVSRDTVPEKIITGINPKAGVPLYIVNGKETDKRTVDAIKPETIEDIRVFKADVAEKVYGEKGKNGVIILNLKPEKLPPYIKKLTAIGSIQNQGENPYVEVDGKEYKGHSLVKYMKETGIEYFEEVEVFDKIEGPKRYGQKASDGAIIVTIKKVADATSIHRVNDLNIFNPEPKIYLGNNPGGKISLDYLKTIAEISLSDGYSFVSCAIWIAGPGIGNDGIRILLNSKSLSPASLNFDRCKSGATITFDNVRLKDKDGLIVTMKSPPTFLTLEKKHLAVNNITL